MQNPKPSLTKTHNHLFPKDAPIFKMFGPFTPATIEEKKAWQVEAEHMRSLRKPQPNPKLKLLFDASNIENENQMEDLIQQTFCTDFDGYGRNLDAFADVCTCGVDDLFEDAENIVVVYTPPKKWKDDPKYLLTILDILKTTKNIELVF